MRSDLFNNSTIYLLKQTGKDSYSNPKGTWEQFKSVSADVQPYNGGLAQKEYGLTVECQRRVYCDKCLDIVEGMGVSLTDGATKPEYTVIYAEHWNDYTTAILKKEL